MQTPEGSDPNDTTLRPDEQDIGFMNQPLDSNPTDFPDDTVSDDLPDPEPDPTYFPPTDPVITTRNATGDVEVLGGFSSTADDDVQVDASTLDDIPGDEALTDAVAYALQRDAATADLDIIVSVQEGVVYLHGTVMSLDDAENAEDVASRVPGVREVVEGLEVQGLA
jgi:hypothetical protein